MEWWCWRQWQKKKITSTYKDAVCSLLDYYLASPFQVIQFSLQTTMRLIVGLAILLGRISATSAISPAATIPRNNNTVPGAYIVEFADNHVSGGFRCFLYHADIV